MSTIPPLLFELVKPMLFVYPATVIFNWFYSKKLNFIPNTRYQYVIAFLYFGLLLLYVFGRANVWQQWILSLMVSCTITGIFNLFNKGYFWPKIPKTWLVIAGLMIPIYFIINAVFQYGFDWNIDFGQDFQNLPNYLVFFATLITAYLLYRTLSSQNKTLEEQKRANQIAEFENRFFKFIDYHRENVNQLKYRNPKVKVKEYYEGNQVFTVIYYEIVVLLQQYLDFKKDIATPKDMRKAINFIYQCVFFGAGKHSESILKEKFGDELTLTFLKQNKVLRFDSELVSFSKKKAAYILDEDDFHVYYTGHIRRLGHYFRNMYQAFSYLDSQPFLSEHQKYEYAAAYRAQMSVFEQAVFFFNSLSQLGEQWELKELNRPFPQDEKEKKAAFKELWITKYDIIRNTLNSNGVIAENVNVRDFYPLLNLEREDEFRKIGELNYSDGKLKLCRLCFNEKYIDYEIENDTKKKLKKYCADNPNFLNDFDCEEKENCTTKRIIKEA